MAKNSIVIQLDKKTRKGFNRFCNEIGLSVNDAFNIFAKTVVRGQRIPFELTTELPDEEEKFSGDDEDSHSFGFFKALMASPESDD